MKELSDDPLVVIAAVSIIISLFSLSLSFRGGITGFIGAVSDVGFVNVTVPPSAFITVHTKSINFTGTLPGETKTSYNSTEVDARDGLPCDVDNYCGMNISNDGTVFINITIQETERLFDSGSYQDSKHFLYNVTMQDPLYTTGYGANGNCSVGYDMGLPGIDNLTWGEWRPVPAVAEVAVCYLNNSQTLDACTAGYTGNSDICPNIARIEFNITVPPGEGTGDKAGTITFTAVGDT